MATIRALAIVLPAFVLAGCLQEEQLINVKADGSGTIVITTLMKDWAIEYIQKQGGKATAISEDEAKERVKKLGEGINFVSAEILKANGSQGIKATYSFGDITKLKINEGESPPFRLAIPEKGKATLTYVQGRISSIFPAAGSSRDSIDLPYASRRAFLAGLKITAKLAVDGKVVRTNSRFVEGATVTLYEVDLDAMLGEEDRLLAADEPKTIEDARKLAGDLKRWIRLRRSPEMGAQEAADAMQGIPGIKYPPKNEIVIEFTPP